MDVMDLKGESIKYLSLFYVTYTEVKYQVIDFREKLCWDEFQYNL